MAEIVKLHIYYNHKGTYVYLSDHMALRLLWKVFKPSVPEWVKITINNLETALSYSNKAEEKGGKK